MGEKQTFFYDRGTLEVKGNDGKSILTSKVWYNFLKAYEMDIAGYNGTCINSTEGGAYIQGTQVMSFQEAINKYIQESFYPLTHIKKFLGTFTLGEVEKDRLRITKLISITITDVEKIIVLCRQGLEACQKNRDRLDAILNNQYRLEEMHKILPNIEDEIMLPKNKIFKQYQQTLQLFLMHVIQSYNIRFEIDLVAIPEKHDNQLLGKAEILLRQTEWYAVIGDLVAICLYSLLRAKGILNNLMN
ncbi:MAG: motility associated factor glycosyltransferase family protein [Syntrophomonadaceae bacterium]|nr:motility associated factor glycosyltransferase family protein [Syntrophomonadaceae bacterium]